MQGLMNRFEVLENTSNLGSMSSDEIGDALTNELLNNCSKQQKREKETMHADLPKGLPEGRKRLNRFPLCHQSTCSLILVNTRSTHLSDEMHAYVKPSSPRRHLPSTFPLFLEALPPVTQQKFLSQQS
jgi:hypothetical protein